MCLCLRVKFGLQSSFVESFMEILSSRYAQIFTFWWEEILFFFFTSIFFFQLYSISIRRGWQILLLMPCQLKKKKISRFSTSTFCRSKQKMDTLAYAGSTDYLCEGSEPSR